MEKRKVLICPLNWGLGHASRCVPIALELHQQGHEVIMASSGDAFHFLKNELPQFPLEQIPDYNIKYWSFLPIWLSIGLQFPKLFLKFRKENHSVDQLVEKYNIDLIISDNRLGVYKKGIPSIYISHQIQLLSPFGSFQNLGTIAHQYFMKSFDEIWIPDLEDKNTSLAGELSHPKKKWNNVRYIGWLSRLNKSEHGFKEESIVVILSGVEPHRSLLEKIIINQAERLRNHRFVIIGGKPQLETKPQKLPDNINYIAFANSKKLSEEIEKAQLVICRSGYSSLMDLMQFNKRLLVIPSPGQTEQEYLASILPVFSTPQSALNLEQQIPLALNKDPFNLIKDEELNLNLIQL